MLQDDKFDITIQVFQVWYSKRQVDFVWLGSIVHMVYKNFLCSLDFLLISWLFFEEKS